MNAKHTPGPWESDPAFPTIGAVRNGNPVLIAECDYRRANRPSHRIQIEEALANATLIAASPDLKDELIELCFKSDTALRYLRHAAEGLKGDKGAQEYLQGFIDEMERRVVSARTAIAKAEGRA